MDSELIVYIHCWLKILLQQGISEPVFYDDLDYKFKIITGKPIFPDQFKNIAISKRFNKTVEYVIIITWILCDSLHT